MEVMRPCALRGKWPFVSSVDLCDMSDSASTGQPASMNVLPPTYNRIYSKSFLLTVTFGQPSQLATLPLAKER